MEIIRRGTGNENKQGEFHCQHCGSIFKATKAEFGTVKPDRDGPYYNVDCPVCNRELFIDATVVAARTTGI